MPGEFLDTCTSGFFYCFASWASSVTNGLFWVIALLAFSVSIMLASLKYGGVRAFGFGSFVGMVGALFLATTTLISWWIASAFILTGVLGIALMFLSEKE